MSLFRDALHIARQEQAAHRHFTIGDLKSAITIMEESLPDRKAFIAQHGREAFTKLYRIIGKPEFPSDTAIFVSLTAKPYVDDYGVVGASRIVEAVYAAIVGMMDETYFTHLETLVTINDELLDPIVVVRDLDEQRNAHYQSLVTGMIGWAYHEAVQMLEVTR